MTDEVTLLSQSRVWLAPYPYFLSINKGEHFIERISKSPKQDKWNGSRKCIQSRWTWPFFKIGFSMGWQQEKAFPEKRCKKRRNLSIWVWKELYSGNVLWTQRTCDRRQTKSSLCTSNILLSSELVLQKYFPGFYHDFEQNNQTITSLIEKFRTSDEKKKSLEAENKKLRSELQFLKENF